MRRQVFLPIPDGTNVKHVISQIERELNVIWGALEEMKRDVSAPPVKIALKKCICDADYTGLPHSKKCPMFIAYK